MNIEEALNKTRGLAASHLFAGFADNPDITYVTGAIEEEKDAGYFRLYMSPVTPFKYFRVPHEAVVGDILELEKEDLEKIGFIITPNFYIIKKLGIFQIPLKTGVKVQAISIKEAKIGETYPSEFFTASQPATSTCSCNAGKETAKNNIFRPGMCVFRSPCRSGCYWSPDPAFGDGWCSDCSCY